MSSFTSGWSCWYCFAAASRVESTQTVNAPSFWGAWAKPSLVVLPVLVPVPPQAATVSIIVAAQPASRAEPLVLRTLFRAAEDFWAVMSDSTGFAGAPSGSGGWRVKRGDAGPSRSGVECGRRLRRCRRGKQLAALSGNSSRSCAAFLGRIVGVRSMVRW